MSAIYWVKSIRLSVAIVGLALVATCSTPASAAGINSARLSLPKGPGSVEGLGRTFEASPASGTASYGVDIAVPPAIGGFGPALSLVYDGGTGATEVGLGWSLGGLPRVRRRTEDGLPRFDATDHFELVGFNSAPELVEVTPGTYRLKHETGAFVRVQQGDGTVWEARSKDGTIYRFGGTGCVEAEGANVVTYLLCEQFDLHGHRIAYSWNTDGGWARLTKVTWNDLSESARLNVALTYEPRPDVQTKFSSGIRQTLADRLNSIAVTRDSELVRRYDLVYTSDRHSRLANVRMLGADGVTAMPTLAFEYTAMQLGPSTEIIEMASPPGYSPANPNVALTDLNGDGLPDLLLAQTEQYRTYVNHDGKRWQEGQNWSAYTWASASLSTTGVQLADMDGDGAADLVVKSGIDSFRYLPGQTPTSFGRAVEVKTVPNFTFEDPDVRLADMDGDRRTDVLITTSTGLAIGYNLSGADWTQPTTVGVVDPTQSVRFSDGHTSLCDINGDRVQDLCYLRAGGLAYWLGRGRGKFEPPVIATGVPVFDDSDPWKLQDLDGDGWLDLVHVGVSNVSFALTNAIGQFEPPTVIPNTPTKSLTGHVEFADMNGSGTTDIVWIDVSHGPAKAWQYLELFPKGRAGLLSKIDNGLGRVTHIEYAPASLFAAQARDAKKPWSTRLNVPMPVVSKISTDSSLGDPLLVSTVEYGDGTWDAKERSFAGFGASIERLVGDTSTPTLVTRSSYETGLVHRVLRGLPTETTKEDESGYVFSRINPKYETRTLLTGLDGTPVEYGYKASETRTTVEGKDLSRARTTQTDWKYDDFGNVTQEVNWGEVIAGDVLAGNDEVIVNRTYANLESDWILGRVASIETRDAKGTLLSLRSHFYDGEPFKGLPLGQVTRGDLRRVESWIAGEKFGVESLYNHDVHGNVVASIDGKGSRSELFYDENHQFLTREVRHVDATTILTWNAKYDGRFGAITSLIDPNGHETRVQHDALGRVTVIVKPGDSDERPTLKFERVVASPLSSVVTRAREQSGTDSVLDTVEVIDGLGRKRGSFSESTQPGSWILSDYSQFDARGNPRLTAYASEATGIVMPALSAALPGTTYVRDALGRVVVSRHPDGAEARTEYAPFSVTSWDENDSDPASPHYGTPTTTLYDAHGRVRSVIERDAGREIVTGQYAYDGLGNLLSVTDALGRQRSYAYDGRSRRTVINDPNAGTWTMTYTDGNDLESRVGPDGSRVSFLYDSFGRAVEERHSSPIVPERIAVRYHYDISTVEHPEHGNTLGQLAWVEDDAGAKYFGYDARGRLTDSTRKWFDGVEHYDWTDYDAHERMVRRGFPDRTHLSVSYDSRGLLSSVGGLATQLKWNVDGKLSSVTLGNGITDVHGYDARRRLTSMSATDGTGTMVRGFSLGLDAASRVTSITDLRPNVPVDESMTASFLYDSRYRLRQATYAAGTTAWELDDLAKITKVSSAFAEPHLNVTNIYGDAAGPGAGPDQLIRHGAEALTYDAAGRVVTDGERQLSWDVKGRLARVVRAGVTEEYVYGYNDSRALKKTTKGDGIVELTRYIAEDIEERNGSLIRYAFLGEQRLARLDPVDAGKRAAPVTKTLARADSSGMDASGRLASGTDSGIFRRANALRALWTVCAVTLLALACFLCRPRKDKRLYWSVTGATSCALAAIVFIACGSSSNNQSKELSVTERLRAESVEIATVPEGTEFYLPDAQVTPLAVTKANGQVRSRSLYHAYGQVRAQSGEHTDPFGFVGNEEDRGSGLSDFNARSYRPELGIFYAVDPLALFEPEKTIGAPSRLLAYAYAGGDPINNADPSGLVAWGEVARGLGAEALDTAKGIASSVVEMAKSDIALLSQGRIAEYAQTALIDRGEQGIVATIENVANLVDDVKKVFNAESDYEAGRLAVKPLLTIVSVGTIGGVAAGKLLNGRGVRPKAVGGGIGGAVSVKPGKWDYFFGRVTSNPHNQARSLQNLKDLNKLGFDEAAGGREALMSLFQKSQARMGSGKTEAALSLVSKWMDANVVDGMYAALPTMATANGLFERVTAFASQAFEGTVHVRLAHGRARKHQPFQALFAVPRAGIRRTSGTTSSDDTATVLCGRWLLSRKRSLLAQVGVGTVDQALLAALLSRHHFVGLSGLATHAVVVDEVHAYDAYMQTILVRLLEWMGALGTPVVLLSATLTRSTKDVLGAAYRRGLGLEPMSTSRASEAYPLITAIGRGPTRYLTLDEPPPFTDVTIEIVRTSDPLSSLVPRLVQAASAGARVAWIRNTVREAQDAYACLDGNQPNVVLFHARYRARDRAIKESAVLNGFGKRGTRTSGIVIATQVIEQSLDLDFDLLVTDIAPMDLLLQRAGRLHRHADRVRPNGYILPRLIVVTPSEEESHKLAYGGAGYVYSSSTLWITQELLAERSLVRLPADIRLLVEGTYDTAMREARISGAPNEERLRKAEVKYLVELDDYRAKAEKVAIRPPWERLVPERTHDDEALLAVRTRLGMSQLVLPVLWNAETCAATTLDNGTLPDDPDAHDAFRLADALLDELVSVPGDRIQRGVEPPGETEPWSQQRDALVRFLASVGLEEVCVVALCQKGDGFEGYVIMGSTQQPRRVTYDLDKGLMLP